MLKAAINMTRLVFKTFPKVQKMKCGEYLKGTIQAEMLGALEFLIGWLQISIRSKDHADKMGLVLFDKFKETRCYSKTLAVIDEYNQRYKVYAKKMRVLLSNHPQVPLWTHPDEMKKCSENLRECLVSVEVLPAAETSHNIGVDYLVSLVVLLEMIATDNL